MEEGGTWDGVGATFGSNGSPRTMLALDRLRRPFVIITRLTGDGGVGVLDVITVYCEANKPLIRIPEARLLP